MITQKNKVIVRRFLEELDKDLTAVDEFLVPNCIAHLPGNPEPTNRDGFKQFVSSLYTAFPDLHHMLEDQVTEDNKVVSRVTARGTHQGDLQGIASTVSIAPTGRQIKITDIIITYIKEGKIVELWAQFDVLGLLQQVGFFQPPK